MVKPNLMATEDQIQKRLLDSPLGGKGSGAVRFGAAMYFYNRNLISADVLEIYRRCCKLDAEDPLDLCSFEGLQVPDFSVLSDSGHRN